MMLARSTLAIALVSIGRVAAADFCWHSEADFGSVQGGNQWEYLYRAAGGSLVALPIYSATGPNWSVDLDCSDGTCFWTVISPGSLHPNGQVTSDGRTPIDHDVVLGWRAPQGGWYRIEGTIEKDTQNPTTNGVYWTVVADGVLLDDELVTLQSPVHHFGLTRQLDANTRVEFSVAAWQSNDWGDTALHSIAVFSAADLNRSCVVDAADLAILLGGWGTAAGDVDGNGTTDGGDLAILLASWSGS